MKEHDHVANAIVFTNVPRLYIVASSARWEPKGVTELLQNRRTNPCHFPTNRYQNRVKFVERDPNRNHRSAIERRFGRTFSEFDAKSNATAYDVATFATEGGGGEGSSSTRSNLLWKEIGSGNEISSQRIKRSQMRFA